MQRKAADRAGIRERTWAKASSSVSNPFWSVSRPTATITGTPPSTNQGCVTSAAARSASAGVTTGFPITVTGARRCSSCRRSAAVPSDTATTAAAEGYQRRIKGARNNRSFQFELRAR